MTADLTQLPPSYIRCRTFGHAWDDVDPTEEERTDFDVLWPSTHLLLPTNCVRCGMRRLDVIKPSGSLAQRRYLYPEGYLMVKGDHRPKRDAFRLQLLQNRLLANRLAKRGKG